jgi:hypothetical protein
MLSLDNFNDQKWHVSKYATITFDGKRKTFLFFDNKYTKHSRHFDYSNQHLNMRMRTNFADKRWWLGRYSSLEDSGHWSMHNGNMFKKEFRNFLALIYKFLASALTDIYPSSIHSSSVYQAIYLFFWSDLKMGCFVMWSTCTKRWQKMLPSSI